MLQVLLLQPSPYRYLLLYRSTFTESMTESLPPRFVGILIATITQIKELSLGKARSHLQTSIHVYWWSISRVNQRKFHSLHLFF